VSVALANFTGDARTDAAVAIGGGSVGAVLLGAQASTSVTLTSSENPANPGDSVTFTATVTPVAPCFGQPTGTITFADNGTPLPGGTVALSSGAALYTITSIATGTHTITATYSGDAWFQPAMAAPLTEIVQ